jgi:elongation factor G
MQDVRVSVYDGKHHPVDSKEVAFVSAGRKAFLDALSKARAIVLEPIVSIEIVAPDANMGDITGDLSGRRGQVTGTDNLAGSQMVVSGVVPLSELDGYANRLKSITAGRGAFSMQLSHYEPVPPPIQKDLVAQYQATRKQAEED